MQDYELARLKSAWEQIAAAMRRLERAQKHLVQVQSESWIALKLENALTQTMCIAEALNRFDEFLGEFLVRMEEDDVLMITSDHGTDPAFMKTTDHTREDVPFLAFRTGVRSANGGCHQGFYTVGDTVAELLEIPFSQKGRSLSSLAPLLRH